MDRKRLKSLLRDEQFSTLEKEIQGAYDESLQFDELLFLTTLKRKLKLKQPSISEDYQKLRIAIIGGDTLYPLTTLLEGWAFSKKIEFELWSGEYNNYEQEILDLDSDLYKFSPDFIVVIPKSVVKNKKIGVADTLKDIDEDISLKIENLWNTIEVLKKNSTAEVIVCNSALALDVGVGNIRGSVPGTDWSYVKKYNLALVDRKIQGCQILDVEYLSSSFGTRRVFDYKFYYETKNIFAPNFLVFLASEIVEVVHRSKIPMKKCLICDLDNTLWGGVIGDDGIDGIELDEISTRGYAFKDFQKEIKSLKDRGVVLAIASKNEYSVVKETLRDHPDCLLREEDFVCVKANWNPKSDNIKEIANRLNLGLNSFVFIDDNPAEIEIVNQYLPEVETILLGKDPTTFVDKLKSSRFFEPKSITSEDVMKTSQYKAESVRKESKVSFTDLKSYLKSLEMKISFSKFESINVSRISQLTQKSNQFNLTTKRRTESEVKSIQGDKNFLSLSVHLEDKFGDYGLVGVNIFEVNLEQKSLIVDTWLMSCRVLKRQVEEELVNFVVNEAKSLGLEKIIGIYLPTKKNIIVKDLYQNLGFIKIDESESQSTYELDILKFQENKTQINY